MKGLSLRVWFGGVNNYAVVKEKLNPDAALIGIANG